MRTGRPRSCWEYLYKHGPVCFFPGGLILGQFSKTQNANTNLLGCYLFIFKSEAFGLIPHRQHIGQGRLKLQTQHPIKIVHPPWLQVGTKKNTDVNFPCVFYILRSSVQWLGSGSRHVSGSFFFFFPQQLDNSQFCFLFSVLFLLQLEIS